MTKVKKTYKKRTTDSKISVVHYLNTKAKGKGDESTGIYYPIYVRMIHKGKVNYMRSLLEAEVREVDYEKYLEKHFVDFQEEVDFLTERIRHASETMGDAFTLKLFAGSGSDDWIFSPIEACLMKEIKAAIMMMDHSTRNEIIDPLTGAIFVGDEDDPVYIEQIARISPLSNTIDWTNVATTVLDGLTILIKNNPSLNRLKERFSKRIGYYELLFREGLHLVADPPSVRSWELGFIQVRLRRIYRATAYEQMCNEYIENIDQLLAKHHAFKNF